jgi:hypothetical protein
MQGESFEVFNSLRQGGIEAIMITGDSPYTAVQTDSEHPLFLLAHITEVHRF